MSDKDLLKELTKILRKEMPEILDDYKDNKKSNPYSQAYDAFKDYIKIEQDNLRKAIFPEEWIEKYCKDSLYWAMKNEIKTTLSNEIKEILDEIKKCKEIFGECPSQNPIKPTDTSETDRLQKEIDRLNEELKQKQEELESANNINKDNSPPDNGDMQKLRQQIETLENENRSLKIENKKFKTELEEVKEDYDNLKANNETAANQLPTVKEERDRFKRENQTLKERISKVEDTERELNSTKDELSTTKAELSTTKSELSTTKNELSTAKNELTTTKNELNEANDKFSITKNELNSTKAELSATKNKLNVTESELATTEEELTTTKRKLSETTNELSKTKNELSEIKNDLVRTEAKLNGYEDATKLYGEIYNCMTECESVKPAFADMGIKEPEDNYEALPYSERIKFITHFSPDYGFARIIYNALDNYKNKEHTPITEQEQQLISAINDYYRRLLGKSSYDALDYLDIIKNNKHGKETDFKRQSMKSLTEPRRTDFYTVKDIYVPALRRPDDGSIDKKAIVEAE